MPIYAKLLPTVFGALMIVSAVLNLHMFLGHRRLRWIEVAFGRTALRVIVGVLGAIVIAAPWFGW